MGLSYSAIALAIILIGLGVGLIAALRHLAFDVKGSDWGALLAPLVAYLVLSGYLAELKAPGFEAKLIAKIEAPVPSALVQAHYIVGGDAPFTDIPGAAQWGRAQRVIAIEVDVWEKLTDAERITKGLPVAVSVYQSLLAGGFQGLVVLGEKQKPLGIFEGSYFLDLLRLPLERYAVGIEYEKDVMNPAQLRAQFLETQLWGVLKFPRQRSEEANKAFITYDIPRSKALAKMVEGKFEVLVVLDGAGRYMGVVSRKQLVDQLLLDLAEASKPR
jgi:hypothetical protein